MTDKCTDCPPAPAPAPASGAAANPAPVLGSAAAPPVLSAATATGKESPAPVSGGGAVLALAEAVVDKPEMRAPHVLIEFCDRCRWAPRASWMQTELLLTFPPPLIRTVTLQPMNEPWTGGRFRVWVDVGKGEGWQLAWDRKTEGGFPELKVLKQRVRNLVQPDRDLGHSDVKKPEREAGGQAEPEPEHKVEQKA